jgi:hypothetical protein
MLPTPPAAGLKNACPLKLAFGVESGAASRPSDPMTDGLTQESRPSGSVYSPNRSLIWSVVSDVTAV